MKYARSDLHLTEIFDSVCETMSDYIVTLEDDGTHSVVRRRDSSGIPLSLRNIKYISDKEALLQFYVSQIYVSENDLLFFITETWKCFSQSHLQLALNISFPLLPFVSKVFEKIVVAQLLNLGIICLNLFSYPIIRLRQHCGKTASGKWLLAT